MPGGGGFAIMLKIVSLSWSDTLGYSVLHVIGALVVGALGTFVWRNLGTQFVTNLQSWSPSANRSGEASTTPTPVSPAPEAPGPDPARSPTAAAPGPATVASATVAAATAASATAPSPSSQTQEAERAPAPSPSSQTQETEPLFLWKAGGKIHAVADPMGETTMCGFDVYDLLESDYQWIDMEMPPVTVERRRRCCKKTGCREYYRRKFNENVRSGR